MARLADRLPDNAPGDFFVDRSCIDCDLCRQIAPEVFGRRGAADQSIVTRQPETPALRLRAAMALVACPTTSIGTADKQDVAAASLAFPELVTEGVYHCGYASASSYGASSYLLLRPQGNVLIDSPRAARPLLKRITELGGVKTMVLTHRDDVADHRVFHEAFGCERVLHLADVEGDTRGVEVKIEGSGPVALAPDLTLISVPGHTRGSMALLYQERCLFTGDHLWLSEDTGRLEASRNVCWYSWAEQTRSMKRLLDYRFTWVLPGHGRRYQAPSSEQMRAELLALVEQMSKER
jgi:glyoxylase-like metal-dependent hydrolase (beta-lactamase superfamily II)/ferredoxin